MRIADVICRLATTTVLAPSHHRLGDFRLCVRRSLLALHASGASVQSLAGRGPLGTLDRHGCRGVGTLGDPVRQIGSLWRSAEHDRVGVGAFGSWGMRMGGIVGRIE